MPKKPVRNLPVPPKRRKLPPRPSPTEAARQRLNARARQLEAARQQRVARRDPGRVVYTPQPGGGVDVGFIPPSSNVAQGRRVRPGSLQDLADKALPPSVRGFNPHDVLQHGREERALSFARRRLERQTFDETEQTKQMRRVRREQVERQQTAKQAKGKGRGGKKK